CRFWRNAQCNCAFLLHVLFPVQRARAGGATRSVMLPGLFNLLVLAQRASLCCATRSAYGQG
ncbi:hypothetical protein A2U01_0072453, partial [Trifolium medium]|nr:hypothetical protein [Trifolium medium]